MAKEVTSVAVRPYGSDTPGGVPDIVDMEDNELAINTADRRIWAKSAGGSLVPLVDSITRFVISQADATANPAQVGERIRIVATSETISLPFPQDPVEGQTITIITHQDSDAGYFAELSSTGIPFRVEDTESTAPHVLRFRVDDNGTETAVDGEYVLTFTGAFWTLDNPVAQSSFSVDGLTSRSFPCVSNAQAFDANELHPVVLTTATGHNDPRSTTYSWVQISGQPVAIRCDDKPTAYFIAPEVNEDTKLVFLITVTDAYGFFAKSKRTVTIKPWLVTPIDVTGAPYNAAFDNVTDDRVAIQTALNDAEATGSAVILPDTGTAYVASVLSIRDGVQFFGSKQGNPVLRFPDTMRNHIWVKGVPTGEDANVINPVLCRFTTRPTTVGRDYTTRDSDSYGLRFEGVVNPIVYDVDIVDRNFKGIWMYLAADHGANITGGGIYGCNVLGSPLYDDPDDQGIHINHESTDTLDAVARWKSTFEKMSANHSVSGFDIIDNVIEGGRYGIGVTHYSDGRIENNTISANTRSISLQQGSTGNIVRENVISEHHSTGIHAAFGSSNNLVQSNHSTTTIAVSQGIYQAHTGSHDVVFDGNTTDASHVVGPQYHVYIGPHASNTKVIRGDYKGTCQRAFIAAEPAWTALPAFDPAHLADNDDEGWAADHLYGVEVSDNVLRPSGTGLSAKQVVLSKTIEDANGTFLLEHEIIGKNQLENGRVAKVVKIDNVVNTEISRVNVKSHGAVGDGVTDDTQAFVSAMNQARSAFTEDSYGYGNARKRFASGLKIYVPSGRYLISSSGLSMPWGCSLIGDGEINTVIIFDLDDLTVGLSLEDQDDQHTGFTGGFYGTIKDITLQGNIVNGDEYSVKNIIHCNDFHGALVNVVARHSEQEVVKFETLQQAKIDDCLFEISATKSTFYAADGTALTIIGTYFRESCVRERTDKHGCLHLNNVKGASVNGCVMENAKNGSNGTLISDGNVTITGAYHEANTGSDIRLINSAVVTIPSAGIFIVGTGDSLEWKSPAIYAEQEVELVCTLPGLPSIDGPKIVVQNVTSNAPKSMTCLDQVFGTEIVFTGLTSVDTGTIESIDSTTQITLPTGAGNNYTGRLIEITTGQYEGLVRVIQTYDNTTKIATLKSLPPGFNQPAGYKVVGILSDIANIKRASVLYGSAEWS